MIKSSGVVCLTKRFKFSSFHLYNYEALNTKIIKKLCMIVAIVGS